MRLTKKLFLTFTLSFFSIYTLKSQTFTGVNSIQEANELIENLFPGDAVEIIDVSFNGSYGAVGTYSNGLANLGSDEGIVITTGTLSNLHNNSSVHSGVANSSEAVDPDLDAIKNGGSCNDVGFFEIRIKPLISSLNFKYAFASEEYPIFVCTEYNDAFGLFVSGPNPNGGDYLAENIALIPNTNLPVSINSINNGNVGSSGNSNDCISLDYSQYFIDIPASSPPIFNGRTQFLEAYIEVIACEEYVLKISIGDASDHNYDSGIFMESGSLNNSSCLSNIGIIKTISNQNPMVGEIVDFNFVITHNGSSECPNVLLEDILDENLSFVSSTNMNFDPATNSVSAIVDVETSPNPPFAFVNQFFSFKAKILETSNLCETERTNCATLSFCEDEHFNETCIDYTVLPNKLVGSNVGILRLSQAINDGILDPNQSSGISVLVDGSFVVDVNYSFNNECEILFEPGSSITVRPGTFLSIFDSHLHACNKMWQGIIVPAKAIGHFRRNLIEDAENGLNIDQYAHHLVRSNTFNSNLVGIRIQNREHHEGFFQRLIDDNLFTSTYPLVAPYFGQVSIVGQKSYAGILVKDLEFPFILTEENTYNGVSNGFISQNTDVFIENQLYIDIQQISSDPYEHKGNGILIFQDPHNFFEGPTLVQKGKGEENNFVNCRTGIRALNSNVFSENNSMLNCDEGLFIRDAHLRSVVIQNNQLNQVGIGVQIRDALHMVELEVNNNYIESRPGFFGGGILLSRVTCPFTLARGRIENPAINESIPSINLSASNFGIGIGLSNSNQITVFGNSIKYPMGRGISQQRGFRNWIQKNESIGNGSTNSIGIFNFEANECLTQCNVTDLSDVGIKFDNTNNNNTISMNDIYSHDIGLSYTEDAITGPQYRKRNEWLGSYTQWGAEHLGNNVIIVESIWTVKEINPTGTPPSINGDEWFAFLPGNETNYDCINLLNSSKDCEEFDFCYHNYQIEIFNSSISNLSEVQQFDVITYILENYFSGFSSNIDNLIEDWISSNEITDDWSSLISFIQESANIHEQILKDSNYLTFSNSQKNKKNNLDKISEYYKMLISNSISESVYIDLVNSIYSKIKDSNFNFLISNLTQHKENFINSISSKNYVIDNTLIHDYIETNILSMEHDFYSINLENNDLILELKNECVEQRGRIVELAKGLSNISNKELFTINECEDLFMEQQSTTRYSNFDNLIIGPNPSKNEFVISNPFNHLHVVINDLNGNIVYNKRHFHKNILVKCEKFTPGMYFVSCYTDGKKIKTQKQIVLK